MKNDELYHHGIKGMHWYQRRFQNPDGSLTEAGKKRYLKEEKRAEKHERKKQEALASGKASKIAKYRSELSDEDVEKAISRINMQTRMDQALEAQRKVGTDKLNRITNTVKTTANNIVDIYDTSAAIANATGLLEKELPVLFKDQKRKGVTVFDRGLRQRVSSGTASDAEEQQYLRDQHRRLERGNLSDEERTAYQNLLQSRQDHGIATDQDRSDISSLQSRNQQNQRNILTPTAAQYSAEEDASRQRQYQTTHHNAEQLGMMRAAAREVYGANDQRTMELDNAYRAMRNAATVAETRASAYSAGNPDVRQHFTSRYNRAIDRAVNSDAVNRRARTQAQREARDRELNERASNVDNAFSALRNIDMEALRNRYPDLLDIGYDGAHGMTMTQRERIRELRNRANESNV